MEQVTTQGCEGGEGCRVVKLTALIGHIWVFKFCKEGGRVGFAFAFEWLGGCDFFELYKFSERQ